MSLSAAVWPQFEKQAFGNVAKHLRHIASYVSNSETTFTFAAFRSQAVRSASPSDSRALVQCYAKRSIQLAMTKISQSRQQHSTGTKLNVNQRNKNSVHFGSSETKLTSDVV